MRTLSAIVPALLPLAQRFLHFCLPNCCLWCDFAVQQPATQLCDYCQAALPRLHWLRRRRCIRITSGPTRLTVSTV